MVRGVCVCVCVMCVTQDITKKDKNTSGQEESGDEETSAPPSVSSRHVLYWNL